MRKTFNITASAAAILLAATFLAVVPAGSEESDADAVPEAYLYVSEDGYFLSAPLSDNGYIWNDDPTDMDGYIWNDSPIEANGYVWLDMNGYLWSDEPPPFLVHPPGD